MADATLSGYKAAAQSVTFSGTQTLVSLADNEWTSLSDAIDNSSTKYMLADLEVVLGSYTAGTTGDEAVEIYIVPSVDGTNYPDWTDNVTTDQQENNQYFVGSITVKQSGAATKRGTMRNVALPNGLFKFGVRNRTHASLAASGSTLKWRPHQYASA